MTSVISSTQQLFSVLSKFVEDMNSSNSDLHKEQIFTEYAKQYPNPKDPFLKTIVLVNDNLSPFNVTSDAIVKFKNDKKKQSKKLKAVTYEDKGQLAWFELLGDLISKEITGDKAKQSIVNFINQYPEHEKLILNIIDKDLKIRFTGKSINKIIPGFIPLFQVSLGEKYDKSTQKYLNEPWNNGWYISRKLDGVRCICKITFESIDKSDPKPLKATNQKAIDSFFSNKKGCPEKLCSIEFYSRQGKPFLTLQKLKQDIEKTLIPNIKQLLSCHKNSKGFVLDGEVCAIDNNGLENFQGIMREINKKNHVMSNPKYLLFDMLTLEEFEEGSTSKDRLLSTRQAELNTLVSKSGCERLSCIQQVPFNEEQFQVMQKQVTDNGWEGLILRKNDVYIGDRSKDILKVKKFSREEYTVKNIETTKMRVIDETSGLEAEIDTLKAVIISHKGYDVSVGSGFSLEERKTFYEHPEKIIGKVISVQYFEETKDLNGELSLRFPTFKGLYGNSREF